MYKYVYTKIAKALKDLSLKEKVTKTFTKASKTIIILKLKLNKLK